MTASYPLQASFTNGQISELLASRVDVDFWRSSLSYARNFSILSHGGIRRRSGTRYVAEARNHAKPARILSFRFSEMQSYVLAFNDGRIRYLAQRGVVGAPYEITHPYTDGDLRRLSYAQFNDVAYMAHRAYKPMRLERNADTNWSLNDAEFRDGPYLELDLTHGTKLIPAGTGAVHPTMTSNNAPSGTVSSSGGSGNAYRIFDADNKTNFANSATSYDDLEYEFGSGLSRVVDAYWIRSRPGDDPAGPTTWEFQGWNGTEWVTLDSRQAQTGWARGETRFFEFENTTAFFKYRLAVSGSEANSGLAIAETGWHENGDFQTAFNLTASATAGINDGAGFQASDVGRTIRLQGSDARWRWARIDSVVSTLIVTIRLYGHALPDKNPIIRWQLGAFSELGGFPAAVTLYDERVMWAATGAEPVTVYGSRQGDFTEYGSSEPPVGTDGIKITLLSSNMNEILWLADDLDLIAGSPAQIRSVGPSDVTQSFSATNITQRKGPTTGASSLAPLAVGGTILYAGAGGTKIRELVMGEQNRYVAPELSVLGERLFKAGIVAWAFAEKPDPTIYAVTGDGLVAAVTYDREQKVLGFTCHDFGGFAEDVTVVPGVTAGADDVYFVIRRTVNGQTRRYYEVLEKPFDHDADAIADAFFLDCGLTYSGAPISTVTGLAHLEGEEVWALVDGSSVGPFTVTAGQIVLGVEGSKISVGLPYTSRAVTMPVAGPGQDGTLFGRRVNVVAPYVDILASGPFQAGADGFRLYDQNMQDGGSLFTQPPELKTGFIRCDIEGSWTQGQGKIAVETAAPLPLLIRAISLQVENEP